MAKAFMYNSLAILFAVVFLTTTQTAYAGPACGVVTSHHATNYQAAYAPAYHQQYQNFVPVVQQVQVVPDFFYSSAGYARDEALLEALKLLRESRTSNASKVEEKRSTREDDPFAAILEGVPDISGGKVSFKAGRNESSELVSLIESKCVRCHNGSKGHVNLSDFGTLSKKTKMLAYEEVAEGSMPPNGALNKEQKRLFREWAYGND